MEIKHPKRILILGSPNCGTLDVIKYLTGSIPQAVSSSSASTAGLTHEWDVRTAYYNAKIPIWIDEIVDIDKWTTEFLKPEAKEVVEAVGGWIFCFQHPITEDDQKRVEKSIESLQNVVKEHTEPEHGDAIMLCVKMPLDQHDLGTRSNLPPTDWDDICLGNGFEYIDSKARGTNEFGEKVGLERLKEALEAHEWDGGSTAEADTLEAFDLDDEEPTFGDFSREEAAMTAEIFGMKAALLGDDDWKLEAGDFATPSNQAKQVDDLDRMMGKLLAIKEQGADMPEAQKKRMAAQAIRELMEETGGAG